MISDSPPTVLLLRPGALGDTLMLLPLLAEIEGKARVAAAARRPGLDLLRSHAERCVDWEGPGWHRLYEEEPREPPDRVSALEPGSVLAFLSDPDGRVERNLGRMFPGARVRVFSGYPRPEDRDHAALYLARCAAAAGLPVNPEACLERAQRMPLLGDLRPAGIGPSAVVLHPGSGGRRKNLEPAFWLRLLDRLAREVDVTVLLGPAEEALRPGFEQKAMKTGFRVAFAPETDELVSLLSRARFYAGHDSGVTHLAAMLGTPCVALFRTTDAQVWAPLGPRVEVIEANEEHAGLVEQVARAAEVWLGRGA